MSKTLITSLLTLLGPGVGHIYLKQFKKAVLFILATTGIGFYWFVQFTLSFDQAALETIENLSRQQITPAQQEQLNLMIMQQLKSFLASPPQSILFFELLIAGIWAYAFVDGYLAAKALEPPAENKQDESTPQ